MQWKNSLWVILLADLNIWWHCFHCQEEYRLWRTVHDWFRLPFFWSNGQRLLESVIVNKLICWYVVGKVRCVVSMWSVNQINLFTISSEPRWQIYNHFSSCPIVWQSTCFMLTVIDIKKQHWSFCQVSQSTVCVSCVFYHQMERFSLDCCIAVVSVSCFASTTPTSAAEASQFSKGEQRWMTPRKAKYQLHAQAFQSESSFTGTGKWKKQAGDYEDHCESRRTGNNWQEIQSWWKSFSKSQEFKKVGLTLSLPRVINFKFVLQTHQKY